MARDVPLREHLAVIREADLRFEAERDRRYTEVALARAEALRIKEEGDRRALELAREIQTYKDEKANELREQINRERVLYATKEDLKALGDKFDTAFKPVVEFMAGYRGGGESKTERRLDMSQAVAIIAVVVAAAAVLIPLLIRK